MDQTSTDKIQITFIYCVTGNFRGRKLLRLFSLRNLGVWYLWRSKSEQSEVFSAKNVFFTNLWKFSPLKVSCYAVLQRCSYLTIVYQWGSFVLWPISNWPGNKANQ